MVVCYSMSCVLIFDWTFGIFCPGNRRADLFLGTSSSRPAWLPSPFVWVQSGAPDSAELSFEFGCQVMCSPGWENYVLLLVGRMPGYTHKCRVTIFEDIGNLEKPWTNMYGVPRCPKYDLKKSSPQVVSCHPSDSPGALFALEATQRRSQLDRI